MTRRAATARTYARALERELARHSEGPFVFSERDWDLATRWHDRGVPLGLVLEILRSRKRPAHRLGKIASDVDEQWNAVTAGRLRSRANPSGARPDEKAPETGAGVRAPTEPSTASEASVADVLRAVRLHAECTAALGARLDAIATLAETATDTGELDTAVDRALLDLARPERIASERRRVREALDSRADRWTPAEFRREIDRALARGLRRTLGLPRKLGDVEHARARRNPDA